MDILLKYKEIGFKTSYLTKFHVSKAHPNVSKKLSQFHFCYSFGPLPTSNCRRCRVYSDGEVSDCLL